jgi:hypothetical protein
MFIICVTLIVALYRIRMIFKNQHEQEINSIYMAAHVGMVLLLFLCVLALEVDVYGPKIRITYYWVETLSNTIMALILYFTNINKRKETEVKRPRRRIKNTGQIPTERQVPHLTADSHVVARRETERTLNQEKRPISINAFSEADQEEEDLTDLGESSDELTFLEQIEDYRSVNCYGADILLTMSKPSRTDSVSSAMDQPGATNSFLNNFD